MDRNNPIKEKLKTEAWDKFATWAYSVGLPFNAVCDESFQDMINAIGEYGRGMPAPSYYNIRVSLMKRKLEETKAFVDSFRPHWEEYKCSIMSDFWTDGKGRCLINFLVNCPFGTVFLKSIDASEHVKSADLIVKMINEVIIEVGEANIVQFITDNGSNFKSAGGILQEQHPRMFWTPCAAHCVNLMIQDIAEKIPKIKTTLTDARAIVVFIYNHERILNLMRKLTKNKELHRSCVTRFATQFYTIQSVHENRHHIQVLFVSEEWRKSSFSKTVAGKRVERIAGKTEFWDSIQLACQVLAPLVDVIRLVDTEEKPSMGYIYDAMVRAKEQITKNVTDVKLVHKIKSMIQARWTDQLHHPLHAAGYYLNLAILHGENSKDKKKERGSFDGTLRDIWWRTYGIDTPLLQSFAISVLSQTCSASPSERSWSTFDNLHSKKRNCLLQQKLNDLVFIQYNPRLQRRFNSLKANRSLDPILLRDVEENDDWVTPTQDELQDFVQGTDGLRWTDVREAMGGNEEVGPSTRTKRSRYRDDDDDVPINVEDDLNVQLDEMVDVDSEEDFMSYD
ncbi:uncharacterized protein LOC110901115 [Helianthus annuus]|uniref:uncharacterized protein LOC110901115 n=1 Tax=Helianthus annuus TaxID=4232 RepID=UPI001652BA60|nr:uncharacterized protein LOC110901115 [Helianthus annuus]